WGLAIFGRYKRQRSQRRPWKCPFSATSAVNAFWIYLRLVTTPPTNTDPNRPAPANSPDSDLGFGRVVVQSVKGRFLNRDGSPNSKKYGLGAQRTMRLYLASLYVSWPVFLAWMTGVLLLINGVFALAYSALGIAAIAGTEPMQIADPFVSAFTF